MINFSWRRMFSIALKEWNKVKRDTGTITLIMAIPIFQIILFGYAINIFPKKLPTAVINNDHSPLTRRFVQGVQTSDYFDIKYFPKTITEAEDLMQEGKANFIIEIPTHFTRDLLKAKQPHILLITDTSMPGAFGFVLKSLEDLSNNIFERDFRGALNYLTPNQNSFLIDYHLKYNPNLLTTVSIVPGLIGVILTISLSLVTSITLVEEKESGTIEMLLNSPIQVLEIIVGKFFCYLIIGYIQLIIILLLSIYVLFDIPMRGNILLLLLVSLPFLMSNLMLGLAASSISQNQTQAQQIVSFFFLPSILLSGFVFPFYGMPFWAQIIGNILPLTHYNRIVSGIMLKAYQWHDIITSLWPILVFLFFITFLAVITFRKTLD